jgi:hypothetical protein
LFQLETPVCDVPIQLSFALAIPDSQSECQS